MAVLAGKRILLGVTGGIAAYKSAELLRRLVEYGAEVQVVMTAAAAEFVTPLTFQALSGRPVRQSLLDPAAEAGMGHIELARWPDFILIAPASAHFLARLAHGLADDLLTTLCLATNQPIAVAPAMNRLMWANPATQDNCRLLSQRHIALWGPGAGEQACGETGAGRMLEPLELRQRLIDHWTTATSLNGCRVLITAGPTREAIDPVRFISNHSSGRMGFAVAAAAAQAGAEVILVSGPVQLTTPPGVQRIDVASAQAMYATVMQHVVGSQIFIAVAAVADYRVTERFPQKMKKSHSTMTLNLERTPDILASVAGMTAYRPFCVGFAAETDAVLDYARRKLIDKNLDLIAANHVGGSDRGFNSLTNALHVLWRDGERHLPLASKQQLAVDLITLIAERYDAQSTA
jgi:phosphopantothenoylcysteine decarboxylase/phosphopantothenate--cysteine ligase